MRTEHFVDPFLNILPKLDLHGETRDVVRYLILDFINTNLQMGNYKLQIVHGRRGKVLKNETHAILKECRLVERYYVYGSNDGVTIVELKQNK